MNRVLRVALATTLFVGALSATQLSQAGPTFACSCIAPPNGAPAFTGAEGAVVIGTVGPPDGRGIYTFAVERWFHGGSAANVRLQSSTEVFPDGSVAENTCGLRFEVGERLILAAGWMDATTLRPSACSPHALVASAEGQELISDAVGQFGEGATPGASPDPGPGAPPNPNPDLGLVAIALVTFVVGLTAAAALLAFARRREQASTDPP